MNQTAKLVENAIAPRPQTNAYARWVPLALGIALAIGGQVVLLNTVRNSPTEGWMQALAGILLLAGAWLFGTHAFKAGVAPAHLEFPHENGNEPIPLSHNRRMILLLVSIGLGLIACVVFMRNGETQVVRLLWLASVATMLIAPVRMLRIELPRIAPQEQVYLAMLAMLLVVALATRVYNLTLLPYNVDGDFADVGLQARALASGQEQRIFAYGWAAVPMLGYLPEWLTMKLFGDGLAGLNVSGVIEGLLLIVGVFLLGRELFSARVGLFAAAVLTVSYAHLAASRQSSYIDPVLFMVFAIYFLLVGLRRDNSLAILVSGLLTALCVQMYYSGRLVVIVAVLIFLYLLVFRPRWRRERWQSIFLWGLAVLITLGPMLIVFAGTPEGFITRMRFVFIFLNPDAMRHLEGVYHVDSPVGVLLEQARRTALLFHYYSDTGTQFGFQRPYFDPLLATLFTLGLGYALFHCRRFGDGLLLAWLLPGLALGSFLALDPPFWTRLMILLPPTALLAARALDLIYETVSRALAPVKSNKRLIPAALVGLVLVGVGILNWNTYVLVKETAATEVTRIGRYLAAQPPAVRGYLVSEKFAYDVRQLRFLAPDRLVSSLTPNDLEATLARRNEPTLLILTDEQGALVKRLTRLYPRGSSETHVGNTPNEIAFYVFHVP